MVLALIQNSVTQMPESPFKEFFTNPGKFIEVHSLVGKTIGTGEFLAPLLFMVALCFNYVNTWMKEGHKGKFYDPAELKRTILVMLMIPLVPAIFSSIEILGNGIGSYFEMTHSEKIARLMQLNEKMNKITELEDFSIMDMNMEMLVTAFITIMMYIMVLLMYVIRFMVMLLVGVLIKFLIVVSPLATSFSILPFLKDQIQKLLQIFMNAAFVVVTLNILDHFLFASISNKIMGSIILTGEAKASVLLYKIIIMSFSFALIVMYLLSVWLTSKYAGAPGAAAALGMAATMGTVLIAGMAKLLGGAKGGSGSAAGSEGSLASTVAETGAESMIINKGDN